MSPTLTSRLIRALICVWLFSCFLYLLFSAVRRAGTLSRALSRARACPCACVWVAASLQKTYYGLFRTTLVGILCERKKNLKNLFAGKDCCFRWPFLACGHVDLGGIHWGSSVTVQHKQAEHSHTEQGSSYRLTADSGSSIFF